MTRQVERRSVARILLLLVLHLSALAPLIVLASIFLAYVLHFGTVPSGALVLRSGLIFDLSLVFGAGLVSLWITSRGPQHIPSSLWICFVMGALVLMATFPTGTVVGCAALVALWLMKVQSRSKEPS